MPAADLGVPQFLQLHVPALRALMDDLTTEQCGVLLRAIAAAWEADRRGAPPCSLPANPDTLRWMLRAEWAVVQPVLERHFHRRVGDALICPWLLATHEEVQTRRSRSREAARTASFFASKARAAKSKGETNIDRDGDRYGHRLLTKNKKKNTTSSSSTACGEGGLGAIAPPTPPPGTDDPPGTKTMADVIAYYRAHPEVVHEPPPTP